MYKSGIKLLGALLIFLFLSAPVQAKAENEFSTSYIVNYDIQPDTTTQVTQKITLKNLTSRYYASNFSLIIGSTTTTEITANDEAGPMETKTEVKGNKTVISVRFNQQVAGLDKSQTFTIKFKSKDFATQIGKTWEVNLPKIPEATNLEQYNLTLSVPSAFGSPTSIAPLPKSQSQTSDRYYFSFVKDQLKQNGVSVNFGSNQVFNFVIKYPLENNLLSPVITKLTLPPDTNYQDIKLTKISPSPDNVEVDRDGNFLAVFKLPRLSKQEIVIEGSAKLYIKPKNTKKVILTDSQNQEYTKSDKYWEKENPAVQSVLTAIFKDKNPTTNSEKAKLIFHYVVNNLKYDTSRIEKDKLERLGAITVLNNPSSAVCMEFTDLFITLARASNIPARELDGYAYSYNSQLRPRSLSNNELLHAWPEYFDEQRGWVMIDPTWTNTSGGVDYFDKFDLNHFVMAIRGISSESPDITDNVKVEISMDDFSSSPNLDIQIDIPRSVWAGFPIKSSIKISNIGTSVFNPAKLSLKSNNISVSGEDSVNLEAIPPFGSVVYDFNLKSANVFESFEDVITVKVGEDERSQSVTVKPFFYFQPFPYIFAALLVFILGMYAVILGVHIYKKRTALPV